MDKTLRAIFSASSAVLAFVTLFTPTIYGQTANAGASDSISTQRQLAQSLGNFAIIPPPNADAAKSSLDSTTAATPQSVGHGIGGRSNPRDRNAPRRENLQAFSIAGKHVNALIGGFELGAGFGFGIELTTANSIPGIEFRAKLLTSTRWYRRFEGQAYIPKLGSENTHLDLWFNYQLRTKDNFFGIGPRTPEFQETNFASDERSFNAVLSHDIADRIQAGIYARIANSNGYRGEDDNDPEIDLSYTGRPGGEAGRIFLPGLNVNAKLFSYGAFVEIDRRNNEEGLPKGGYFYARVSSFNGLENDIFDDFGWNEVELDGRVYIPIFSDSTSLALRGYTELKDPKRGSQIPFYDLAWLGGRNFVRGFRNFRFRGNNTLVFNVEPRQTVWKQDEDKGLDVFVFGDAGQVWGDNRSRALDLASQFDESNWRFGFGGGFQYRFNKSTAFRVDIGHTNERNMVYFSVSRGF